MIERQTIAGKPATVAYLTKDMKPCTQAEAALVRVIFDDGHTLWLTPSRARGPVPRHA